MIQTTLREVLEGKIDARGHDIYLFREGDTVLYIGHSIYPLERVRGHISSHESEGGSGKLGKLIRDGLPNSLDWIIELFSLDDCDSAVRQQAPEQYESFQQHKGESSTRWVAVDIAEQAVISHYRPLLNVHHNRKHAVSLNATQAAAKLGVHEKTVRRWIDEGKIEATHLTRNRYAIPLEEVERMAEEREQVQRLADEHERDLQAGEQSLSTDERIASLESRVSELEGIVREMGSQPPIRRLAPPRATYAASRPSENAPLPAGLVPINDLIKEYHLPRSTVIHHMRPYLKEGNWKSGGSVIHHALDAEGVAEFMRRYEKLV